MEIENILAKSITVAGEKAAYDAACKRLLANKIIYSSHYFSNYNWKKVVKLPVNTIL